MTLRRDGSKRRGKNPFANSQKERVDETLKKLDETLRGLARLNVQYSKFMDFRKHVAELVGVDHRTLRRNKTYLRRLIEHVGRLPGGAMQLLIEEDLEIGEMPESAKDAMLLTARMEIGEMENQIRIRDKQIAELKEARQPDSAPLMLPEKVQDEGHWYKAFQDLAMALFLIRDHLGYPLFLAKTGTIEDTSGPPSERKIVGPERTKEFFKWLKENQELLDFKFDDDGR